MTTNKNNKANASEQLQLRTKLSNELQQQGEAIEAQMKQSFETLWEAASGGLWRAINKAQSQATAALATAHEDVLAAQKDAREAREQAEDHARRLFKAERLVQKNNLAPRSSGETHAVPPTPHEPSSRAGSAGRPLQSEFPTYRTDATPAQTASGISQIATTKETPPTPSLPRIQLGSAVHAFNNARRPQPAESPTPTGATLLATHKRPSTTTNQDTSAQELDRPPRDTTSRRRTAPDFRIRGAARDQNTMGPQRVRHQDRRYSHHPYLRGLRRRADYYIPNGSDGKGECGIRV